MELMEKTVESRVLFEGKIITVRLDKAELPNGRVASREVVEHPGGVAILPLFDDGTVSLPLPGGGGRTARREVGAGRGPPSGRPA